MGRWEPGAGGRLRQAAIELMVERGYDAVTVADIAERAGVTPRTFFRHYADKAEVLFEGSEAFLDRLVQALVGDLEARRAEMPPPSPLAAIATALDEAATMLGADREWAARRRGLLAAHPELLERELHKLSRLARAWTEALTDRGCPAAEATLAAEVGVVVLRVGLERWVDGPPEASLAATMRATLAALAGLIETA